VNGTASTAGLLEPISIAMEIRPHSYDWEAMWRRRSNKPVITFGHYRVFTFGNDEELIRSFGSIEEAEVEWARLRSTFMEAWNLWGMPEAWWRFEPGVPDELRVGPAMILTAADADELRELDRARRRYLTTKGIDPMPPIGRPFRTS
jgi:hypothetical protein